MATIIKEIGIDAPPATVWAALRDFGAVHERLAKGFLVDGQLEDPETRVVTFFNGAVAREILVGVDDDARRLAYSVVESPLGATHYNASAQAFSGPSGDTRFVWIIDVLPDDVAARVDQMMGAGLGAIKQTLESSAP